MAKVIGLNRGFSVLELLVGVAILAGLMVAGLPLGQWIYQKNQEHLVTSQLSQAITIARHHAFTQGLTVSLSPLPGATDWSKGIILFVDNPRHQYTSQDKVIRQWEWVAPLIKVNWQGFLSKNYLLFSPSLQQATCNGRFIINIANKQRNLVINRLGHYHWINESMG